MVLEGVTRRTSDERIDDWLRDCFVSFGVLREYLRKENGEEPSEAEIRQLLTSCELLYGKPLSFSGLEQFLEDQAQLAAIREWQPSHFDHVLDRIRSACSRVFCPK